MRTRALDGLLTAGALLILSGFCHAHGGIYRGPGDVVPPNPGGGGGDSGGPGDPNGPTTGGPAGPTAPAPRGPRTGGGAGPATGGPGGPGGGRNPSTGSRGVELTEDFTEWKYWWEFNKDRYLRLKDAVQQDSPQTGDDDFYMGPRRASARDALKPTEDQLRDEVLPALKQALDATEQRDVNSSCMVAMAKVGTDHPDFRLIDVFTPRLRSPDQEIREVAALSIGIAAIAGEEELGLLVGLALDDAAGRAAAGGAVDYRTRSFAIHGLGLLAHEHSNNAIKARVFTALRGLVDDDRVGNRNTKVAAISAIGILNIDATGDAGQALRTAALQCLADYFAKDLGAGEQLIQAHCPTAIAKLVGRDAEANAPYKQLFAAELRGKGRHKRASNEIAASCAMALGQMVSPYDDDDATNCPDAVYSQLLLDVWHDHKDAQTRNFAVLALGQIGGKQNRTALLREFDRAGKNQQKPWCALALGIYAFDQHERHGDAAPDTLIGETLFAELKRSKDPSLTGALAIGLGLCRTTQAADLMRSLLLADTAQEEKAGYLCIGLALMNDSRSVEDIRNIVGQSVRRDRLLQQAAIALGKLGDKRVADDLQKLLSTKGETNLAKLSAIAAALGFIGDRRTIRPLRDLMSDTRLSRLAQAFAAAALGGVADKESLRWNAKIAANMNYRAAVETLTNQGTGVLDIL